jgi:hypothetical protein
MAAHELLALLRACLGPDFEVVDESSRTTALAEPALSDQRRQQPPLPNNER